MKRSLSDEALFKDAGNSVTWGLLLHIIQNIKQSFLSSFLGSISTKYKISIPFKLSFYMHPCLKHI